MSFKQIFQHGRVAGIAGNRHQGKTNNILRMLHNLRREEKQNITEWQKGEKTTPKPQEMTIYAYGLPKKIYPLLSEYKVEVIDSVKQLANKENSLFILDEFQRLKLNDRRNKHILVSLMDMIYHANNYVLFCSPTTREYNSIIGGFIEVWLLKSMYLSDTINGSQLKNKLLEYKGHYEHLGYFKIPKDEMVLLNDEKQTIIKCEYLKVADSKTDIRPLF